jgi:ERCC4-type nuclease
MQIIIDTREQKPLEFAVPTLRECLNVGDYSCRFEDGHIPPVVFERKSLGDIYGTLSGGYDRFKREMQLARELEITLIIIIEGSLRRVLSGYSNSRRTPISLVYQLFTIRVRYGIHTVFTNTREEMSEYITHLFLALEREYEDSKKREPLS